VPAKRRIKGALQPVVVAWADATLRNECLPVSQAKDAGRFSKRQTVGWLVSETEEKVVLAVTFDEREEGDEEHFVDDLYTIPTSWVQSLTFLAPRRRASATTSDRGRSRTTRSGSLGGDNSPTSTTTPPSATS
jgi:hypothetical protein